jgi:hypothetical protein
MTRTFFPDSAALMSPRTAKYVEAMIREGDNFDYHQWLERVREEEAEAKQAQARATSGEFAASGPPSTPDSRPNPRLQLETKIRTPIAPRRLHSQPKNQTSEARLFRWLEKVHRASGEFQTSRRRDAVYVFLGLVFEIVEHYKVRRRTGRLLRHACRFAGLPFEKNMDPFTAVIRCTSGLKIDGKTVSKYARALRYASRRKDPDLRLKTFMKEAGGVNACANLYAKHFGRGHTVKVR